MGRPERPNILLIVIDSGRLDRFGCYGYGRGTTPAIDALARESIVYEHMIAPAPWTLPSHASLFTGLYPREHGADYPALRMRSGLLTLDRYLSAQGYTNVFFSNNPILTKRTWIFADETRLLMRKDFNPDARRPWIRRLKILTGMTDRGSGATNRAVHRVLRESHGPGPLFIFVNYMECHWQYLAPRAFERRFVRRRLPSFTSARYRMRTRRRYSWENARVQDADEAALLSDLYDAALACVDDRVGDLLEALDRDGHRDTVVVVTADHGEHLGDHGLSGHGMSLHQTLLRVPFVIRIPGIPADRLPGLVQLTEVFAALCVVLGIPVPDHLRERPFSPSGFQFGRNGLARDFAFAEYAEPKEEVMARRLKRTGFRFPPRAEMVRDTRYSLIVEPLTERRRLFDLQEDPAEQTDRADRLPAQRDRLHATLEQWRAAFQPRGSEVPYTPEEQRAMEARLRDLGYA